MVKFVFPKKRNPINPFKDENIRKIPSEVFSEIERDRIEQEQKTREIQVERLQKVLKEAKKELLKKEDHLLDSINSVKKRIKKIIKKELNNENLDDRQIAEILGDYNAYFDEQIKIQKTYMKNIKKGKLPTARGESFHLKNLTSRFLRVNNKGRLENVRLDELKKKYKIKRADLLSFIVEEINEERALMQQLDKLKENFESANERLKKAEQELAEIKK